MSNLFSSLPSDLVDEFVETLIEDNSVRIERIVSRGHVSASDFWYDQNQSEWVIVLQGQARLLFADETEAVVLGPGDYVNIPAHTRHRVEWTTPNEPTVWLAVFYGFADK